MPISQNGKKAYSSLREKMDEICITHHTYHIVDDLHIRIGRHGEDHVLVDLGRRGRSGDVDVAVRWRESAMHGHFYEVVDAIVVIGL